MNFKDPIQRLARNFDQGLLKTMVKEAIREAKWVKGKHPTKNQVLDLMFSKNRGEPEAEYLAQRLDGMISRYLESERRRAP